MRDSAHGRTTRTTRRRNAYDFARTPRWLAGHALAGVLLVIFLIAGFWQLNRHGEQREANALVAERQAQQLLGPAQFFSAVAAAGSEPAALEALDHRTVRLSVARMDWTDAVHIRNRSFDGVPGCHIAVPIAANVGLNEGGGGSEGEASYTNAFRGEVGVLVVAGWLPQGVCGDAIATGADAFRGGLSDAHYLTGRIRLSQQRGLLGPTDPAVGRLVSLARTDVERIDQQAALDLVPVYVELIAAAHADATPVRFGDNGSGTGLTALLRPLPSPELDGGPHLGYALQWFSFALVAVVGYTLVLRHQARKGESERIADD